MKFQICYFCASVTELFGKNENKQATPFLDFQPERGFRAYAAGADTGCDVSGCDALQQRFAQPEPGHRHILISAVQQNEHCRALLFS
jgi:hypothetical protein